VKYPGAFFSNQANNKLTYMIQVGINENVILTSVALNDKNTLSFTFEEKGTGDKPMNPFEALASDEVVDIDNGKSINLFQPNVPDKADMTQEKKVDIVTSDINKTKGILIHFLKGWMTKEEVKGAINPFAGTAVDATNYATQLLNKEVLAAIHKNMSTTFIQLITPFLAQRDAFRLLLVRQSADKHWPSFRGKYIEENPFWESMQIPAEASKLKFTAYEISQKLNDGTPVSKDNAKTADSKPADTAPVTAQNVFGGG
jgi:hypothetical protein